MSIARIAFTDLRRASRPAAEACVAVRRRHRCAPAALLLAAMYVAALVVPVPASAQNTRSAEAMYEAYSDLSRFIRGGQLSPNWLEDGSTFWYATEQGDTTAIYLVDPIANTKGPFFDTHRLRRAVADALGGSPSGRGVPFQRFRVGRDGRTVEFRVDGHELRMDLESYEVRRAPVRTALEGERTRPRVVRTAFPATGSDVLEIRSPDGRWFLGERDHNLYLRSTYDGRKQPLTNDGQDRQDWLIQGGRATNASGGARWSPDGTRVVVFRADNRAVPRIPLVHWLKRTEEVEWTYFSRTGDPLPQTDLYVIDVFSRQRVRIDTGDEPDQYLHVLGWLPDNSELLFLRMNRTFDRLDVMAADPRTGDARLVLRESQETFIKGIDRSAPWRQLFTLLPESGRFLWQSERDGWDHLYLYDLDGRLIRRLTRGVWPVLRVVAVDETDGWVYFTANAEHRVYDTHVYRVGLDGQGFQRLTEASGQHTPEFSPSRDYFLVTHSSVDRPPAIDLRRADGHLVRTVSQADISELEAIGWYPPEEFVAKSADGTTDLHGVLYRPFDFDPRRQYPVINFLYSGPQVVITPRTFSATPGNAAALAHLGFIVVIVDPRGTPERGKAFMDVVHHNWGRHVVPDHVAVLGQLAEARPYMDLSRVGVYGNSWGGYYTVRAMVQAPDMFHVGVATYPVVDLYDHWAQPIEPYMGLPQENPEAYEYASSLRLADRFQGNLLLIHGTSDVNAPFSATMKMIEALTRAGKPYDLIVMPGANHSFSGDRRRYRQQAIRRYFETHLCPACDGPGATLPRGARN